MFGGLPLVTPTKVNGRRIVSQAKEYINIGSVHMKDNSWSF